jgi:hypothetical protein
MGPRADPASDLVKSFMTKLPFFLWAFEVRAWAVPHDSRVRQFSF